MCCLLPRKEGRRSVIIRCAVFYFILFGAVELCRVCAILWSVVISRGSGCCDVYSVTVVSVGVTVCSVVWFIATALQGREYSCCVVYCDAMQKCWRCNDAYSVVL